jgi:hypothetical protein
MHNVAQAYGQRPSTVLGVPADEEWLAYQVDAACLTFGRWVENRLAERDREGRPVHTIDELLREEGEAAEERAFFDPRSLMGLLR